MTGAAPAIARSPADLYLDLLARSLTRALQEDSDWIVGLDHLPETTWRTRLGRAVGAGLRRAGFELVRKRPYAREDREHGRDWPARAESMAGLRRMANARMCIESVLADGIPGDVLEAGVWRGGMSIFMRGVLAAHGVEDRTVWLADSFRGLPAPDKAAFPADRGLDLSGFPILRVSQEEVRRNFARYGLLDERVRFLEGWFADTLPAAPVERLAVLRLDGDLYESTIQALEPLYPKLAPGGYCIIDDYGVIEPCRRAVADYRAAHGIAEPVLDIDGIGAYWRKDG